MFLLFTFLSFLILTQGEEKPFFAVIGFFDSKCNLQALDAEFIGRANQCTQLDDDFSLDAVIHVLQKRGSFQLFNSSACQEELYWHLDFQLGDCIPGDGVLISKRQYFSIFLLDSANTNNWRNWEIVALGAAGGAIFTAIYTLVQHVLQQLFREHEKT